MLQFGRQIVAEEGFIRGLQMPGLIHNSWGSAIAAIGRVGTYPMVRD